MGQPDLYLPENDTGPDDAVHDRMGLFIYYDPREDRKGEVVDLKITDVAPTLLEAMGLPIPSDMEGKSLLSR